MSFISLGLSVGKPDLWFILKLYTPAASNPLVALSMDLSFDFVLFPVVAGTILIIIMSIFLNKIVLSRKYPKKKLI